MATLIRKHNTNRHLSTDELENNINGLPVTETRLRELFDQYDTNGNGFIDENEMKNIYKSFENFGVETSEDEVHSIVSKYSVRKDGKVTFDQFCVIMLSLAQR
eukprot:NODE_2150_length_666_cov_162.529984_g1813_i0.p1 GENE.NODE_2150_length_666_cov_162.529984_g1813_i0~~NODE_2150_length_666_cov_162.529984_g1813_i0.p1  ORF type:complete len:103 (-),score=17.87 NODE_2150_length_666_cov_162.529984_g1813_i0:276-584(-)